MADAIHEFVSEYEFVKKCGGIYPHLRCVRQISNMQSISPCEKIYMFNNGNAEINKGAK